MQEENGNSALKIAQDKGHHEVVQLLLDHGAGDKHGSHDSAASGPSEHDKPVKLPQGTDSEMHPIHEDIHKQMNEFKEEMNTMMIKLIERKFEQRMQSTMKTGPRKVHPPSPSLTLHHTFRELLPLASEWQNIGTFLEIPPGKLKTIKSDNPHRVKDCLREMLTEWLDNTDPHPTWKNLAEAIHPFSKNIAMVIHHKYCTTLTS